METFLEYETMCREPTTALRQKFIIDAYNIICAVEETVFCQLALHHLC